MTRLSTVLACGGVAATIVLTGCGGSAGGDASGSGQKVSQKEITAALEKPTKLTFWAWGPQYAAVVAAFNKAHPKVQVKLLNEGSGDVQYTKLQNVLKAGSGVPDVAQIEYSVMPQFALGGSLTKLDAYGVNTMKGKFSTSAWDASRFNGALYGLPQDAGPLAMFYRQDVFDKYGLTVPKTWAEYTAVAKKLKAADASKFITADAGDPGTTNALIWQAGGRPYKTNGQNVTVDLNDQGANKWSQTWSTLIDDGLVDTKTPGFTPEWNAGLANGKYATLITGAWAAGTLQNRIPTAKGKWRVAPVPQYAAGDKNSAQLGGSLSAVMKSSKNSLAAIGFVEWMSSSPAAAKIWADLGGFPCAAATLASQQWLNLKVPYFNGQQINQIFADSDKNIGRGWQFLPFQGYANSVYADTVGQAYVKRTDLSSGMTDWQKSIVAYGKNQGFKIQ